MTIMITNIVLSSIIPIHYNDRDPNILRGPNISRLYDFPQRALRNSLQIIADIVLFNLSS